MLQPEVLSQRRAWPDRVADGDVVIAGQHTTASPRRHDDLLSKTPAATGLEADLAPRHYRIPLRQRWPGRTTDTSCHEPRR